MTEYPKISRVGLDGVVVTFGDVLADRANLAAIAFRHAVDVEGWEEVRETASVLVSTFLSVDLVTTPYESVLGKLNALLETRDWYDVGPPAGRKLWTLPMCFDPQVAPQLTDAAKAAGLSETEARDQLINARTRVIALGFAPGQPYLGHLPEVWDIPRQSDLTPKVPVGALVIAIRQFVLFATSAPTGWRHVGQTAFRPFDQDRDTPVLLSPGDEVRFAQINLEELKQLQAGDSLGGAEWEQLS